MQTMKLLADVIALHANSRSPLTWWGNRWGNGERKPALLSGEPGGVRAWERSRTDPDGALLRTHIREVTGSSPVSPTHFRSCPAWSASGGSQKQGGQPVGQCDALLDRFVSTVPGGERVEILSQIMRRVTDDLVFMGMFHIVNPTLIHDRLSNVTAGSAAATAAWNAHEWALK